MFAKSGSYVLIEARKYLFWDIFQDESVMLAYKALSLVYCSNYTGLEKMGGCCQPHAAKVQPLLDQVFENIVAPCGTK